MCLSLSPWWGPSLPASLSRLCGTAPCWSWAWAWVTGSWRALGAFLGLGLAAADYLLLFICLIIVVAVSLTEEKKGSVRDLIYASPAAWKYIIFGIMTLVIIVFGAYGIGYDQSQFIYNQF